MRMWSHHFWIVKVSCSDIAIEYIKFRLSDIVMENNFTIIRFLIYFNGICPDIFTFIEAIDIELQKVLIIDLGQVQIDRVFISFSRFTIIRLDFG